MRGKGNLDFLSTSVLTSDDGGDTPTNGIVESHGSVVDIADFSLHTVDMEPLYKEPSKCGEEEVVQQDGNHSAEELEGAKLPTIHRSPLKNMPRWLLFSLTRFL